MADKPTGRQNPGPDAERLKIESDWEDAVKRALEAKPPNDDPDEPSKVESEED